MKDFTKGKISSQLFLFSLPLVAGDVIQTLSNIAPSIWVGHLLGKEAFAAVSSVIPLLFFLFSLGIGISIGTNILIGQAYGRKDFNLLSKIITNSFLAILASALLLSLLSFLLSGPVLSAMNTPPEIEEQTRIYFKVLSAGLILVFIIIWTVNVLRAFGDSKTPLYIYIIMFLLNTGLTPLLIKGFGIIPAFGFNGVAYSYLISGFITSCIAFTLLLKNSKIRHLLNFHLKPDFAIVERILLIGLPASLQMLIVSLSGILLMALVNRFGPDIIVTFGAGLRADQIAIIPSISMGAAVSVLTAQNIGAGKFDRIGEITRWGILISAGFAMIFFVWMMVSPQSITAIFNHDPQVLEYGSVYFRTIAATYLFFSVGFVYQGIVRGAGQTVVPLIFATIATIIVRIPLCYLLAFQFGHKENGIWLGMLITGVFPLVLNFWYYKSGRWEKKLIEQIRD